MIRIFGAGTNHWSERRNFGDRFLEVLLTQTEMVAFKLTVLTAVRGYHVDE